MLFRLFSLFAKRPKPDIWTERMICLYERQVAAREALGEAYCCHPSRDVHKIRGSRLRAVK